MHPADITVLVLTYNEEANIGRTLAALAWAQSIVIVDSGSSDDTRRIATRVPTVRWCERPFDSHAAQWNYGLSLVTTEWTLALDADYVCPDTLADELRTLSDAIDGYEAGFTYVVAGRPLTRSLYPPHVVLFRTRLCHFVQDGHTQRLSCRSTRLGRLRCRIAHDDRKPRSRWLESQRRYAVLEAERILAARRQGLGWRDWLRQGLVLTPVATFVYCLIVRRLIFDGWRGLAYTLERTCAEVLLALALVDRRLASPERPADPAARV